MFLNLKSIQFKENIWFVNFFNLLEIRVKVIYFSIIYNYKNLYYIYIIPFWILKENFNKFLNLIFKFFNKLWLKSNNVEFIFYILLIYILFFIKNCFFFLKKSFLIIIFILCLLLKFLIYLWLIWLINNLYIFFNIFLINNFFDYILSFKFFYNLLCIDYINYKKFVFIFFSFFIVISYFIIKKLKIFRTNISHGKSLSLTLMEDKDSSLSLYFFVYEGGTIFIPTNKL